jgi:protein gp37
MAGLSDIEWTDATWNPVAGCSMISPGCTNCYAMRMAALLQSMDLPAYRGTTRKSGGRPVWTGKINLIEKALDVPLRWRKPRKIFVNSMSDIFQDGVPDEFIQRVWRVMLSADQHVYQVLTKRPDNMRDVLKRIGVRSPPHIWLGTSIENADHAYRISELSDVPANVRFVSFEPLLGAVGKVDLSGVHWRARPMETAWVSEIKSQCRQFGTAFFFKQWGGTNKKAAGRKFKGRTWDEYPAVAPSQA